MPLLERLGYGADRVLSEFRIGSPSGSVVADAVGFARSYGPFDSSTATLVAEWVDDDQDVAQSAYDRSVRAAWALGAPVALVAAKQTVAVYAVTEGGEALLVGEYAWSSDLGWLRDSLSPRALLDAKLGHRQLALFPAAARLFARSRQQQEEALAPVLSSALAAAESVLILPGSSPPDVEDAHARAARLVVGALTAVVLRDKERDAAPPRLSGAVILDVALQRHPTQFEWVGALPEVEHELLDGLLERLEGTDYGAVDPSLLSGLYETQLVDSARRRELGMHYTPVGLARRLMAWLPFEEIAPDRREVYDPACGSGTLLLAAHDRLRDLQPGDLPLADSHADLRRRLHGADRDPVAVGIARLSLLLHASPAGNGWDVVERDSTVAPGPPRVPIVVANPPWSYDNANAQDDLAQTLLSRILQSLPGDGVLGVVLPDGWLTRASPAARQSREQLTERCEVLEVWRLPSGTFSGARMGAAVVLARARGGEVPSGKPLATVIRRVTTSGALPAFYDRGASYAQLVPPDSAAWAAGPVVGWWRSRPTADDQLTVASYATVRSGPQPEGRAALAARSDAAHGDAQPPASKLTPFVVWPAVEQFGDASRYPVVLRHFPHDMQRGSSRGAELIGRPKVLVSGSRDPRSPWRVKVAVDPVGSLAAINTVKALLPHDDAAAASVGHQVDEQEIIYGLAALLGSGFASAWLDETNATREVRGASISDMPAPPPSVLIELGGLGRDLQAAVHAGEPLGQLIDALEEAVWGWLGAPAEVVAAAKARLNESPAPEGGRRYPDAEPPAQAAAVVGAQRARTGVLRSVDGQSVVVVVPGRTPDRGVSIPYPPGMPGALLRKGETFVVSDDGQDLRDVRYGFHEMAWLSDAEVERALLESAAQRPAMPQRQE